MPQIIEALENAIEELESRGCTEGDDVHDELEQACDRLRSLCQTFRLEDI